LRNPCIQASEAVTFSVTLVRRPQGERVGDDPGRLHVEESDRIRDGIGVVKITGAKRQAVGRLVLGPQGHGEDAPPSGSARSAPWASVPTTWAPSPRRSSPSWRSNSLKLCFYTNLGGAPSA
jgi:hypothetical protein